MWDNYPRDILATAAAFVLVALAVVGVNMAWQHNFPHDWDCARHGGIIAPPQSPYTASVVLPRMICGDGYRPDW